MLRDLIVCKQHGQDVMAHMLRALGKGMTSPDTDTRLHCMAAAAGISRIHADQQAGPVQSMLPNTGAELDNAYADPWRMRAAAGVQA